MSLIVKNLTSLTVKKNNSLIVKNIIPSLGLSLWLKADAGVSSMSSVVTAWADQSNNGNNAIGSAIYNSSSINSLPAITFDGNSYLQINQFLNLCLNSSIFIVLKPSNGGNGTILSQGTSKIGLFFDGSNTPQIACPNIASIVISDSQILNNTTAIISALNDNHDFGMWINGLSVGSDTFNIEGVGSFLNIGCNTSTSDYNLYGDIAEIIIYNRGLTILERQKVETYLNNKYQIY